MPAPIMAPAAALAEPVVWNEDPQRQGLVGSASSRPPRPRAPPTKNFNPDKTRPCFAEYGHPQMN